MVRLSVHPSAKCVVQKWLERSRTSGTLLTTFEGCAEIDHWCLLSLEEDRNRLSFCKTKFWLQELLLLLRLCSATAARWIWAADRHWKASLSSTFPASTAARTYGARGVRLGAVVGARPSRARTTAAAAAVEVEGVVDANWTRVIAITRLTACRPTPPICPVLYRVSALCLPALMPTIIFQHSP